MQINSDPYVSLIQNRGVSIPEVFGVIHYIIRCYYLSHLRFLSKLLCCKAVIKHIDFIFPTGFEMQCLFGMMDNQESERNGFMIRFICAIFRYKFNSCFSMKETLSELICTTDGAESHDLLVEQFRKRTWHKTVVSNITILTIEEILFHSQRSTYVLAKIGKSCERVNVEQNPKYIAWIIKEVENDNGIVELVPIWDTAENIAKTDVRRQSILQKCGCKKTQCNPLKKTMFLRGES